MKTNLWVYLPLTVTSANLAGYLVIPLLSHLMILSVYHNVTNLRFQSSHSFWQSDLELHS